MSACLSSAATDRAPKAPWYFEDAAQYRQHLGFCPYCRTLGRLASGRVRKEQADRLLPGDQLVESYLDRACRALTPVEPFPMNMSLTEVLDQPAAWRRPFADAFDKEQIALLAKLGRGDAPGLAALGDIQEPWRSFLGRYVPLRARFEKGDFGSLADHLFYATVSSATENVFDEAALYARPGTWSATSRVLASCRQSMPPTVISKLRRYLANLPEIRPAPQGTPDVAVAQARDLCLLVGAFLMKDRDRPEPNLGPPFRVELNFEPGRPDRSLRARRVTLGSEVQTSTRGLIISRDNVEIREWFLAVVRMDERATILGPTCAEKGDIKVHMELPADSVGKSWQAEVYCSRTSPEDLAAESRRRAAAGERQPPLVWQLVKQSPSRTE